MVLLQYKTSEKWQFLIEIGSDRGVEEAVKEVVSINNERIKLDKLIRAIKELAEFGPLKPEALRGLTTQETIGPAIEMLKEDEKKYAFIKPGEHERENPDKTGFRIGIAPRQEVAEKMKMTADNIQQLLSSDNVEKKKVIPLEKLKEGFTLLRGAVMIAYPAYHNLPEWEPVYMILEDKFDFPLHYPDCNWLDEKNTVLWWAKKELRGDKKLSFYIGTNEKTKIIIKSTKKGQGAPVSEPMVDKETQQKMMSYYYKKQEEQKKLIENDEDDFLNSEWANPNQMRSNLITGGRDIRLRQLYNENVESIFEGVGRDFQNSS